MEWTDTALVLRISRFREADLRVRLLTRGHGLLTAFAFGGSRSRRRFCGCLDICNSIVCRIRSTRNSSYLALQEASLLRGPRRLRGDARALGAAVNCLRFLEALGVHGEGAASALRLAEDALHLLEEADLPPIFTLLFRLRAASDQGFAPALETCAGCGRTARGGGQEERRQFRTPEILPPRTPAPWQFHADEGRALCPACRRDGRYALNIDPAGLEFLRGVQHNDPQAWESARLGPETLRSCGRAVNAFVQYHLGIVWEDGRFRKA